MRILIINQHFKDVLGGSEIQCHIIAKNLSKMGNEVFYGAVNSKKSIEENNYKIIPIKNLNLITLFRIFKKISPDIIYWRYNKKKLLLGSFISKFLKIKFVFGVSSVGDSYKWANINKKLTPFFVLKKHLNRRINHFGFYFSDGIITLREGLYPKIKKQIPIKVIFDSMENLESGEFYWPNPFIAWVSNIKDSKNPKLFLEAARYFKKKKNVDFLMIGKIQDPKYSYIKDLEEENFFYLGPKSPFEVNSILKKSLFLIHTCKPEGFGNIFIQAWLKKRPTISFFFDPGNLIKKHEIGFVSGTKENFYSQIEILIENSDLREKMGQRALIVSKELFNPLKNSKKLENFFKGIVNKEN